MMTLAVKKVPNASAWLCFATIIPAATMMHPTGASIFSIILVTCLVFSVRFVARLEGRVT